MTDEHTEEGMEPNPDGLSQCGGPMLKSRTHFGRYVREARRSRGLSRRSTIKALGYVNEAKGFRKLDRLEVEGVSSAALWMKLVKVLDLDEAEARRAAEMDHAEDVAEWREWVKQPTEMKLYLKPFPGFCFCQDLPSSVADDEDRAERFATGLAKERGMTVCLVLDRLRSVWIDDDGVVYGRVKARPGECAGPFMRLHRRGRPFSISSTRGIEVQDSPPAVTRRADNG